MPNTKKEKLIILGASGSGKDFLLRELIKKGLSYSPKFTTRPKRSLEREGIDYNYISNDKFIKMKDNEVKVYQSFPIGDEIWYYGITKENFNNNQVFIMTPHELSQLSEIDRVGTFIVYLDIPEDIRRKRISNRNDNNDSVERRIRSDELDFKGFNTYDLKITDPEFDADSVYELICLKFYFCELSTHLELILKIK
jgi:guanylate kinase